MATYQQLSDFFDSYKHLLSSEEQQAFNNFFSMYPSADAMHDLGFIPTSDDVLGYLMDYDIEHLYVYKPIVKYLDDLSSIVGLTIIDEDDHEPIKANITDANPIERTFTPLQSRAYPTKATVRKRRKQWGGKANYRTYELNARKSMGYALRSMKRHIPKIDLISIDKVKERMKRSISHTMFKADITVYETQRTRMELDLFDAYQQFAYYLFELEQEDTSAKKDAWVFAMPSGTLDDFIKDHYAPTIRAFAELPSEMKAFIEKEWNEYGERARVERQGAYGYNLTQEQVNNLQDADLSYMRELM